MPTFSRGLAAAEQESEQNRGGSFRPFVPRIDWREDGEKKYVLVLTPPDDVYNHHIHEFIPVGEAQKKNGETFTKYESFIARTDLDEDVCHLSELGSVPRYRTLGVAVELEPTFTTVKGRQRATGFVVKTDAFTKKNDDDGEEEVTYPLIGIINQSYVNFWGTLKSYDESQGPLAELPLECVRRGTDSNTRYDWIPYQDVQVDLSGLIDHVGGISYLGEDLEEVINAAEAGANDIESAQAIADFLLEKRVAELSDKERYDELTGGIEELNLRYGGKKKESSSRPRRPARPSQRKGTEEPKEEAKEASSNGDGDRASRFAQLRAQVENK